MATRFYPQPITQPDVTPGFSSGWNKTAGSGRRKLLTIKGDNNSVGPNTAGNGVANTNSLMWQFVSDILPAQTYSGNFRGQFRTLEALTTDDYLAQLTMRAVATDGGTDFATLIALHTNALDASEFATSLTNRKFPLAALSPVTLNTTVNSQHRLVIEVGIRQYSASASNFQIQIRDNSATDLPENETTTTANNSWFEFSNDVKFQISLRGVFDKRRIKGKMSVAAPGEVRAPSQSRAPVKEGKPLSQDVQPIAASYPKVLGPPTKRLPMPQQAIPAANPLTEISKIAQIRRPVTPAKVPVNAILEQLLKK